ncbi:MAG: BglG family transcription antiterminator [Tractidigestivibacter sp.]|uniref:BglG family transcription antiterminator n=1 Tax=Tractidigestivibacter sp. TaxID=2847320 RepID=UPI003D8F60C9
MLDEVVKRDGFSMSALAYRNLLVHLTVALFRIKGGHYVPHGGGASDISSSREYAVACDIALALEQEFSVKMPPEEVEYIAIHLASKRMVPSTPGDEGLVISDEVWNIVSDMLERVNSSFHFDFRENLELRMNLARHIVPLSYRLTYNMNLKNPLVDEMKQRYPLAWSMAVESSVSLVEAYGRAPSDDEIGYLAMSFALALEREKTHEAGKSILIVCASGVGTAKLLKHLYEKEFGQFSGSVPSMARLLRS